MIVVRPCRWGRSVRASRAVLRAFVDVGRHMKNRSLMYMYGIFVWLHACTHCVFHAQCKQPHAQLLCVVAGAEASSSPFALLFAVHR